jgi:hypothetical protein
MHHADPQNKVFKNYAAVFWMSQDSKMSLDNWGSAFWQQQNIHSMILGLTQPPVQCVLGDISDVCEDGHSSASHAAVNACSFIFTHS